MPKESCDPMGAGSWKDLCIHGEGLLAGLLTPRGSQWSRLIPKDCTPWKGPPWSSLGRTAICEKDSVLEIYLKDFLLWEGSLIRIRDECEEFPREGRSASV